MSSVIHIYVETFDLTYRTGVDLHTLCKVFKSSSLLNSHVARRTFASFQESRQGKDSLEVVDSPILANRQCQKSDLLKFMS